ncbi:MAG: IS5/IS1182 family transposase, partial [Selenomonadaceae bacterium]|nr:IS5/IS1182 family transposase [Selenomonadaceae bacterium]
AQLVLNSSTEDILCVFFAKGHEHDFTMFKDSRLPLMVETTVIIDKGYQGITKIHANSLIPFKTKKHKLTPNQKRHNSVIGKNG